jgi:hypothetical protein
MCPKIARVIGISLLLIVIYIGLSLHTAVTAPLSVTEYLFSEEGAYEVFSPLLWYLLAILCVFNTKMLMSTRILSALAAVLLGMREMDLHKSLFEMSFIKTNFYRSPDIAITDKLLGFAILMFMVYLLVALGKRFYNVLRNIKQDFDIAYIYIAFTVMVAVLSKVLDRMTSQLNELFNIQLLRSTQLAIMTAEESFEMLLPVLLIVAVLTYRNFKFEK